MCVLYKGTAGTHMACEGVKQKLNEAVCTHLCKGECVSKISFFPVCEKAKQQE